MKHTAGDLDFQASKKAESLESSGFETRNCLNKDEEHINEINTKINDRNDNFETKVTNIDIESNHEDVLIEVANQNVVKSGDLYHLINRSSADECLTDTPADKIKELSYNFMTQKIVEDTVPVLNENGDIIIGTVYREIQVENNKEFHKQTFEKDDLFSNEKKNLTGQTPQSPDGAADTINQSEDSSSETLKNRIMAGFVDDLPPPQPTTVRIFLSSTFSGIIAIKMS